MSEVAFFGWLAVGAGSQPEGHRICFGVPSGFPVVSALQGGI